MEATIKTKVNSRKINILILESLFHMGGVEKLFYNIVQRLDSDRYDIVFCTLYSPGPMGQPFINDGYTFYHNLISQKYDPRALTKLCKIISKHKIDIIYLITQPLTIFWGYLAARMNGIPVACFMGSTDNLAMHFKLKIYKILLPRVDRLVAQADKQKSHIIDHIGVPENNISVIYNGIDTSNFDIEIDRESKLFSLGIPQNCKIVGIVGRITPIKGIDVFLVAAQRVIQDRQDVHFLVVGDGPQMNEIKNLVSELDIEEKIHLLGFRDDLIDLLHLFDVAVLSSRTEAFPMVILEYMATGKAPVVATDVGSVSEVVKDGVTGIVVEPDNPELLAVNILTLLNDPDLSSKLVNNSKQFVNKTYRIEHTVRNTQSLFDQLVSR